jgi:hypothetical protein
MLLSLRVFIAAGLHLLAATTIATAAPATTLAGAGILAIKHILDPARVNREFTAR